MNKPCNMKLKPLLLLLLATSCFGYTAGAQDIGSLAKQKPFEIPGSLSVGTWYYHANGISNRRAPFGWILSGSPLVKLYGVSFPFTLTISDQDRSFSQPFNRYGVSPLSISGQNCMPGTGIFTCQIIPWWVLICPGEGLNLTRVNSGQLLCTGGLTGPYRKTA